MHDEHPRGSDAVSWDLVCGHVTGLTPTHLPSFGPQLPGCFSEL